MGEKSLFGNPKRQLVIFTIGFIAIYVLLVFLTGGISGSDILNAVLAITASLFNIIGLGTGVDPGTLMPQSVRAILNDLRIFIIFFVIGAAFFAQFVLPLHNIPERLSAIMRLLYYVLRRHGPAISITNGVPKYHSTEIERKGPGVILLDTASAAVLRTPTKFTRAAGPGTVFTTRHETIANAFSLHRQSKMLGPIPGEDPFAEQGEEESDQEYKARVERRWETRATTRDGVEIVPTILTVFQLNNDPNEGQTQFGYNAKTIWKANGREGIDPSKGDDTRQRKVRWDWIPAFMAAELWREYLGKFTFADLFAKPNERVDETAYQRIQNYINHRLTSPRVEHLNEFGKSSGIGKRTSPEFMRLRERGLKVIVSVILGMNFPAEIETRFLSQWRDQWSDKATQQRVVSGQIRSEKRLEGETVALREFGEYASKLLGATLVRESGDSQDAPDITESLELLVRGTLDKTIDDPYLRTMITNEKQDLVDLIEWIRRN